MDQTSNLLQGRASTLCERCRKIDIDELLNTDRTLSHQSASISGEKEPLVVNLGPRHLYFRQDGNALGCTLCAFISELLLERPSDGLSDSEDVFLVPTNALYRMEPEVSVEDLAPGCYANYLYLAHRRPSEGSRLDYSFEVSNAFGDARSKRALAPRVIKSDILDTGAILRWINQCHSHHGFMCMHNWDKRLTSIRLVDVETMRIVPYPSSDRPWYLCLSYVWGGPQAIVVKDSTLKSAPQTILDAIDFVKSVGKQYLWVDSVCIDQKDEQDRQKQVSIMDAIYGAAWATIVALDGSSASAGLSPMHRRQGSRRQIVSEIGRISLTTVLPTLQQQIDRSKWTTRAWTYQEALISQRNIFFTADQVYLACNVSQCCESVDSTTSPFHTGIDVCFDGQERVRGKGIFRSPCSDGNQLGVDNIKAKFKSRPERYSALMTQCSARDMTRSADALAAFQGVLNLLVNSWFTFPVSAFHNPEACWRKESLQGLPLCELRHTLLFVHAGEHERRLGFPSWSWTGWRGRLWTAARGREAGSRVNHPPPLRAWHWYNGEIRLLYKKEVRFQGVPETIAIENMGRPWHPDPDVLFMEGYIWHLDFKLSADVAEPKHNLPSSFSATIQGFDTAVCEVCCYNDATKRRIMYREPGSIVSCLLLSTDHATSIHDEDIYDLIVLDWSELAATDIAHALTVSPESRAGMVAERCGSVRLWARQGCHWTQRDSFKPYWAYVPIVLK